MEIATLAVFAVWLVGIFAILFISPESNLNAKQALICLWISAFLGGFWYHDGELQAGGKLGVVLGLIGAAWYTWKWRW